MKAAYQTEKVFLERGDACILGIGRTKQEVIKNTLAEWPKGAHAKIKALFDNGEFGVVDCSGDLAESFQKRAGAFMIGYHWKFENDKITLQ